MNETRLFVCLCLNWWQRWLKWDTEDRLCFIKTSLLLLILQLQTPPLNLDPDQTLRPESLKTNLWHFLHEALSPPAPVQSYGAATTVQHLSDTCVTTVQHLSDTCMYSVYNAVLVNLVIVSSVYHWAQTISVNWSHSDQTWTTALNTHPSVPLPVTHLSLALSLCYLPVPLSLLFTPLSLSLSLSLCYSPVSLSLSC